MIFGMLWMLSTRLNNRAAIVSKEYRQYNFFGSHVGRPSSFRNNWLQHLNPGTTKCSIQSLFWDQCMEVSRYKISEAIGNECHCNSWSFDLSSRETFLWFLKERTQKLTFAGFASLYCSLKYRGTFRPLLSILFVWRVSILQGWSFYLWMICTMYDVSHITTVYQSIVAKAPPNLFTFHP